MKKTFRLLLAVLTIGAVTSAGAAAAQTKPGEKKAVAPKRLLHSVVVTFETDVIDEPGPVNDFAKALKKVPGFIMKTWLAGEKATVGGIYLFTDKAAADAYLAGEMFQSAVVKDPGKRNVQIQRFDVNPELSALDGTPQKPFVK